MVCLSLPRKLPQIPTDLPWRKIRPTRRRRPQGIATCTSCFSCADLSCVSSFRRGNLQHRRAHRSRAAFQFTLFPGHWTDRLDRSRLSLIWLPWSSGSSACIPVASAIVLLGIQCIIAATGITIHALGRRPLGAQIGFFTACLPISVCHFPPGTSKWNKIEYRLFSFISSNWRGRATARLRNRRPSHCQDDDRERAASDLPIGPPQISNRPQSQQGRNEGHPSSTG